MSRDPLALAKLDPDKLVAIARGETGAPLRERGLANHMALRRGHRAIKSQASRSLKMLLVILLACGALTGALFWQPDLWWLWLIVAAAGIILIVIVGIRAEMSGSHGGHVPPWSPAVYDELQREYRARLPLWQDEVGTELLMGLHCKTERPVGENGVGFEYFYYEIDGAPIVGRNKLWVYTLSTLEPAVSIRAVKVELPKLHNYKVLDADISGFAFRRWHRAAGSAINAVEASVKDGDSKEKLEHMMRAAVVLKFTTEELGRVDESFNETIMTFTNDFNALGDPHAPDYVSRLDALRSAHHDLEAKHVRH